MASVVAILEFRGGIGGHDGDLTLEKYRPAIDKAFSIEDLGAFCLVINSPGGSPVQSHLLAEYIRQCGDTTGVPIFAFVEDMACSGGYLLASAADHIFVSIFSTVGSIGVTTTTFKVSKLLNAIGIEAKTYTSGERKGGAFNHFSVTTSEDEEDLNDMLTNMHKEFIKWVLRRREGKLDSSKRNEIFSGAVFTGAEAIDLGLADQLYSVKEHSIREALGTEHIKIVNIVPSGGSGMIVRLRDLIAKTSFIPSFMTRFTKSLPVSGVSMSVFGFLALIVLIPIFLLMFISIMILTAIFTILAIIIIVPLKIFYMIFIYPCIWLAGWCSGDNETDDKLYKSKNYKENKKYTTVITV